jgi:hypothetical protein
VLVVNALVVNVAVSDEAGWDGIIGILMNK